MPNTPLALAPHYTVDIIRRTYLACENPIKRTRLHLIWLMSKESDDFRVATAAAIVGRSADWARRTINRYNAEGLAGLDDQREHNGNEKILNERQQQSLRDRLRTPPSDKGLWTGPKVSVWIGAELGKKVSNVAGWRYLGYLGHTLQIPRPRHRNAATSEEQAAFKKNSKRKSRSSESNTPTKPSKSGRKTRQD